MRSGFVSSTNSSSAKRNSEKKLRRWGFAERRALFGALPKGGALRQRGLAEESAEYSGNA